MLRSILVALDGSADSAAAVQLGISWARRFDCLLVGVGIVDEPTFRGQQPMARMSPSYKVAYDRMVAEARVQVDQFLSSFALRCTEEGVACKLLEDTGLPSAQIGLEAQRYDLVVIGRAANFHFETQRKDCETLEEVLRCTCRPVVVVPACPTSCREVLVAYDGSVQAARSLNAFVATGLNTLAAVRVVSVHPSSRVEAAKTADRAVEFLRFHSIEATMHPIVSQREPSGLFLSQALEADAGLIVMGAYGQPRIREMLLGSTTCSTLKKSSIPMFLYH